MDDKNIPLEEKELDAEASKEVKEEEIRSNIIAEFGFDEVDDAEKINKLVTREMGHRTKLSTAIGQKIKYRTAAQVAKPNDPPTPPNGAPAKTGDEAPKDPVAIVRSELEARDLGEMPYSKEVKEEIKRVAQIRGITVKEAARDPYIVSRIKTDDEAREAEEAATNRRNNNQGGQKKTFSASPPDVDMTTEEGRKTWDAWKEWMRKHEGQ